MVIVVSISPHLEREMHINSEDSPNKSIEFRSLEEIEMGSVVELDKEPNHVQTMQKPARVVEVEVDHDDGDSFDEETLSNIHPGLSVIGFNVLSNMLVKFTIVLFKFGIGSHQDFNSFNKFIAIKWQRLTI